MPEFDVDEVEPVDELPTTFTIKTEDDGTRDVELKRYHQKEVYHFSKRWRKR